MHRSRVIAAGLLLVALLLAVAPTVAADAVQVRVVSDEGRRIVLEFALLEYRLDPVSIDGQAFVVPAIPGEAVSLEEGAPALPHVARSVIIPGGPVWQAKVLSSSSSEIRAAVAPSKGNLSRRIDPATVPYRFGDVYRRAGFYPGVQAVPQPPYVLRDFAGLAVHFHPFQYDPASETLRVVDRMTVELTPAAPIPVMGNGASAPTRARVRAFDTLYRSHFLNYPAADATRYPVLDEEGEILVIAHDPWIPNLAPYADHKAGLGFSVSVVGVSTIGNDATSIRNYIKNVYASRDLAFVLLVGDAAQVATTIRVVGSENGACDACYGKVAGSDGYPDVLVGRFSAATAADVDTQVDRTLAYETLPAATQAWFKRAVGIASAEGDGIGDENQSDQQHMDQIRGWLLGDGYTLVDRIYDPGATDTQVTSALNAGRGVVNYTGHGWSAGWGTTGFDDADVNALANGGMLPFVVSVACNNGEFHHYAACFGEAWLRAQQGRRADRRGGDLHVLRLAVLGAADGGAGRVQPAAHRSGPAVRLVRRAGLRGLGVDDRRLRQRRDRDVRHLDPLRRPLGAGRRRPGADPRPQGQRRPTGSPPRATSAARSRRHPAATRWRTSTRTRSTTTSPRGRRGSPCRPAAARCCPAGPRRFWSPSAARPGTSTSAPTRRRSTSRT